MNCFYWRISSAAAQLSLLPHLFVVTERASRELTGNLVTVAGAVSQFGVFYFSKKKALSRKLGSIG